MAFIALLGVLTACSSDEPILYQNNNSEKTNPKYIKRTPEQAIQLVRSLSENNQPASRSDESAMKYSKVVDESSLQIIGNIKSRSGEPGDTLIYAVNYSNNDGFVLVSANANTEPILAIVDKGSFDENRPTDNEAFETYLNMAKGYVLNSAGGGVIPRDSIFPKPEHLTLMWKNDTIESFYCQEPRVEVQWGQEWPANEYCPNKKAGCAPLAIAQALTLMKTVDNVTLQFPERDLSWTSLDWNEILKHKSFFPNASDDSFWKDVHMKNCIATEKAHKDIGRLVRQLGVELKSIYYPAKDGIGPHTDTFTSDFPPVLNKYFPGKTIVHYNSINSAYDELHHIGSVAIVTAWNDTIIDGNYRYVEGHTWIADATANISRFVMTYYNYDTVTGEYTHKESTQLQDDKFVHFNWGSDGLFDGYYLLNVFKPGMGYSKITKNMPSPSVREVDYYLALQDTYCIY